MICDFGLARTLPETYIEKGSMNTSRIRNYIMAHHEQNQVLESQVKKMVALKLQSHKEKGEEPKRAMSTHVCSRWYRSPEICILENMYDQATDIWGLGCCLYELMKVIDQEANTNKAILFKGKHCFPLSPCPEDDEDGSKD